MSKNKWIRMVSAYSVIYTVITLLNSVLYLCNGIYEDPSGNWHELDRAMILLIGFAAFDLCTSLPVKPLIFQRLAGTFGEKRLSGYLDQFYRAVYPAVRGQCHCRYLQTETKYGNKVRMT